MWWAESYDDHKTPPDITHPTNLRRWFNEQKHRPGEWLKTGPTSELITEIESANVIAVSTVVGRNGGTFVHKELVIGFHLVVTARRRPDGMV